jgi:hypothetical protein
LKTSSIDRDPELEKLFAAERNLAPYRNEVRQRAFARAKLATSPSSAPPAATVRWSLGRQRWFAGAAVAFGVAAIGGAVIAMRERPVRVSHVAPQATIAPALGTTEGAEPEAPPPESIPKASQVSSRPTDVEGYERELRILEPARRAFARGDFAAVLAAADEHQRMFPAGGLAEERDALRVRALIRQHRDAEARRAAAAFRRRFPHSVLLDEIGR